MSMLCCDSRTLHQILTLQPLSQTACKTSDKTQMFQTFQQKVISQQQNNKICQNVTGWTWGSRWGKCLIFVDVNIFENVARNTWSVHHTNSCQWAVTIEINKHIKINLQFVAALQSELLLFFLKMNQHPMTIVQNSKFSSVVVYRWTSYWNKLHLLYLKL